jgi:hypothetical protein
MIITGLKARNGVNEECTMSPCHAVKIDVLQATGAVNYPVADMPHRLRESFFD